MTDVQSRIAALSPQQRERLEQRLAELVAARGPGQVERIKPRDRSRPTPLGIAQQREWAVEQVRGANNITGAFRVEGALDVDLLSRVLTEVTERHEVLRSTVEIQGAVPVQVVRPVTAVPIPVVDLSRRTEREQRDEVRRRCLAEMSLRFDPADPRRLRVTLLRLAAGTHVALFSSDHAAADAWSMAIIVREIAARYDRHRSGGPGLPAPEIQFGDFAAWQRERFDAERVDAELRHWRETLDGIPAALTLPTDRPYPSRPTFAGDLVQRDLSAELTAELRRLSERESASLVMVLLAASSVLLQRYLGQDDLVIGSLVAGRTRVETEQLIGCFANPLPLRMRLADDQTLREVVRQARDTVSTALDHQDVPFDRLIDALGLGREASQTSLSAMWINALTGPDMTLELPGLRIAPEPVDLGLASVDLTLAAIPRGDRLHLQWQYMTELFDAGTVELLADQFHQVLAQVVTAPDRTVGQVELGETAATRTSAGPSPGPTFVELFQRRVAVSPHAPAVVCDGVATSYADLNRDANRLAHQLRDLGVGPETTVGILVDHSPLLAVAILGALKAGAGYLPLDPAHPPQRIGFMLADAKAHVLVTYQRLADRLAEAGAALPERIVRLDEPFTGAAVGDLPAPDPASAAYVVYTSGSTGRPKGAVIEHRSLAAFARDIADRLALGAGDRFLHFASPSFDVLAEELFPIWLAGGAVVIPTRHIVSGEIDLVDLVERERLTVMELPAAYWHEWVRELDRLGRDLPDCLRLVILGCERVLPDRLAAWRRHRVPLANVYGLTETTVSSTFFHLDPADPVHDWPNLPIGTPLPSADLRILDRRLRPVPTGARGELYLGGVSLARGYLGRPGLTAHRFVADPDPAHPGQRLYRTGDLVRRRADGNLEFLSRVDTQMSIRGFRVEPTEVESALGRHPQVAEAVVALHEPTPGDKRLVAYVVAGSAGGPGGGELRRFLERELPPYMVPSAFVELDALPLSPNGKVDRTRLPSPDGDRPAVTEGYVAAQSPQQQALAEIVASVVGVDRLGIHDNFFEVGGDSILAIQVVARAQEAGLRVTPYDLFAHPTVAALAEVATSGPTVDAEQGEVTGPVPLVPTQRWFCLAGIAQPHHWNTSVLIELTTPVEPEVLRESVERVLGQHDGLRQRLLLAGERTRARIAPRGDETPFEVHDLSGLDTAEQGRRQREIVAAAQAGLDPAVGPMLRVALVRPGGGRPDRVAVVAHRLVADVVSLRLVLEDLETAMVQLSAGEQLRFLPKTTSWQSWARRLARYATSEPVQRQRAYWSQLIAAPAGRLPYDLPADPAGDADPAADTEATARTVTAALDLAETDELLTAAPAALDCTVEELLLAALGRTLSGWTGAPRHLVDLERHDRERLFDDVDLSRTAGWFSRTHPVALTGGPEAAPEAAPDAALRAVGEALRAVPDGGIGWQILRQDGDALPAAPVQLAFGYTGRPVQPVTGTFTVVAESIGDDRGPQGRRPYPIEVEATVAGGRLVLRWRYSERLHHRQTVQRLADGHLGEVRALLDRGRQRGGAAPTAADFPLARVDSAQLAGLLDRL
jgi:amino acid adenylation domain-containing protein/non-ribosomal peptide synthase protein (TIGR01720 family)